MPPVPKVPSPKSSPPSSPATKKAPAATPPPQPKQAPTSSPKPPPATAKPASTGSSYVDRGSGFVLGLLFWTWIALPFLNGGPTGVKNQLRAKFLNKAADGSPLP